MNSNVFIVLFCCLWKQCDQSLKTLPWWLPHHGGSETETGAWNTHFHFLQVVFLRVFYYSNRERNWDKNMNNAHFLYSNKSLWLCQTEKCAVLNELRKRCWVTNLGCWLNRVGWRNHKVENKMGFKIQIVRICLCKIIYLYNISISIGNCSNIFFNNSFQLNRKFLKFLYEYKTKGKFNSDF